tara:strand:- start:2123 stop:3121 length:999 start_codon:yes stop_codon:yes gene_type:complete
MNKLIIKNIENDISDAVIFDLASNYCIPGFYEYLKREANARRNSPNTKKAKDMHKNLKTLHSKFNTTHNSFPNLASLLSMPLNKIREESLKLTLISPRLYDSPVRALVNPFNSRYVNQSIISQKLGYLVGHIIDDINKKKFRFKDERKLNNRDFSQIIASILFLNWFLTKPVHKRPMVGNMKYTFPPRFVYRFDSISRKKFINQIDQGNNLNQNEKEYLINSFSLKGSSNFITLNSDKLRTFLSNSSLSKINNMKRLYLAIQNMGIIETDLLNKLPIFVVLNELSFNDLVFFKRLVKIGYNRVLHLKFLENETIKLIKDQKLNRILNKCFNL